jgi:hypothetical protein
MKFFVQTLKKIYDDGDHNVKGIRNRLRNEGSTTLERKFQQRTFTGIHTSSPLLA